MTTLESFKNKIRDKKVIVLGIGVSNVPLIKTLVKYKAKVIAKDKNINLDKNLVKELEEMNVKVFLGDDYLNDLNDCDYIFRSPGIKPFLPEIKEAVLNGVILTSEIEEVINLAPCKVIGITGSDGKTTTTTLISEFLKEEGYVVYTGGNIGMPLFSKLDDILAGDIIVLELSSFQLMTIKTSPSISVITNISENHLDYHTDYMEYILSKANIFLKEGNEKLILNKDDEISKKYASMYDKEISYFSLKEKLNCGGYLLNDKLYYNDKYICDRDCIKLMGIHNVANILTAITTVFDLVSVENIVNVITSFTGVKHRMQLVHTNEDGVLWYNDSIASSPTRTIAGLNSFNEKIILIAGGYDKKISYEDIGKHIVDKVKVLILMGDTAKKIEDSVKAVDVYNTVRIINVDNMNEAVNCANQISNSGDKVVMSPASASFDKYKNFEERGNDFVEKVKELV